MKTMTRRAGKHRGTAIVLALVLSVIIAGLVMTLAWAAGVQSQITGNLMRVDIAFYNADAGAQRAAWYIKNNTSVAQPLTGSLNGGTYSVTWVAAGSAYRVTSVGTVGPSQNTVLVTVAPPVLSAQTAISIANNLTLKNLAITGNVIVGQSITFEPGSAEIDGDLQYGTSVIGSGSVTGNSSKGAWNGVDWPSLDTTLKSTAGATYGSAQYGKTFNFTGLSGNKVIYVNGDVTNPNFVGTGTLYVNGKVTIDGDIGTAASPVNIVATSDITTPNNCTYYGSLYTKGDWIRRKIDLVGSVYVEGTIDQNSNGNSSINFAKTPWFDNRTGTTATTPTKFTNFAGPNP